MFIFKNEYNQLMREKAHTENYVGILENEIKILKKEIEILKIYKERSECYAAAKESFEIRLKHLLQSEHIREYDEYDRKTHTYKKDIKQFDEKINTYKAAYEKLLKCNCCPATTIKQQPLPFERR